MTDKALRNFTFALPPKLVDELKRHVKDQQLLSLNDAVREALECYIKELSRRKYRSAMQKAATDEDFRRDVEEIMQDFARID